MATWTRRKLTRGASLCLELGVGLLENGGETSRVEESIRLAGQSLGMKVETAVLPTSISVCFGEEETITRIARIKNRSIDLDKVARLNALSRDLDSNNVDLDDFRAQIRAVREASCLYNSSQQALATAVASACLTLVVGGGIGESLVAVIAGSISGLALERYGNGFPSFLSLFGVSSITTWLALAAFSLWGLSTEAIIVGSLLYQMPGLAIVSAMRDLMAGELVAGNARLAEAVLVTLGMATGVLASLGFALRFGMDISL